jgi:RNA-directed DNA polymerase
MNVNYTYFTRLTTSQLSAVLGDKHLAGARTSLAKLWKEFDFDKAQRIVDRLQARIVKAFRRGKFNKVKVLQRKLVRSLSARMLAVKRVTSSQGARTPGIDRICWNTPASRMAGALSLRKPGYQAQPLRRILIAKPGSTKLRPLGIPTIRDRAMQALYLMALDPVGESGADPNSYGFRRHRSTHDALDQVFRLLSKKNSGTWVLDADIKGCFDHISHDWMLQHVPMDKSVLSQWLKCGFMEAKSGKTLFPTTAGTPQGGIASPCLCNMVLDGLEQTVKTAVPKGRQINFVRYADDFVVTARHRSDLEQFILPAIAGFLRDRGLELSEQKTQIRHVTKGFDFLGSNIRKYPDGKLRITPSRKNVKAFLGKVRETVRQCRGSNLGVVIERLNPMIRGWANYHRHGVPLERYGYVDYQVYQTVWRFLKRSHPNKSSKWIYSQYIQRDPENRGRLAPAARVKKVVRKDGSTILKTIYLRAAAATKRVWHLKVRGHSNPYAPEDQPYFRRRKVLKKLINKGEWKPSWKAG